MYLGLSCFYVDEKKRGIISKLEQQQQSGTECIFKVFYTFFSSVKFEEVLC